MKKAVIVNAYRTPIGKKGGSLSGVLPTTLAARVMSESVLKSKINPKEVDEVIFGNSLNLNDNNIARNSWLEANLPVDVPATTVNKMEASSLAAIAYASVIIQTCSANAILVGGVESCSQYPFIIDTNAKSNYVNIKDTNKSKAFIEMENDSTFATAESIIKKYNLTRQECDELAYRSHMKASMAFDNGDFENQIVPLNLHDEVNGDRCIKVDEIINPNLTLTEISNSNSIDKSGILTLKNTAPLADAACALMIMSAEKAKSLGLKPIAVIKEFASAGCDSDNMGLGSAYAIKKLCDKSGLSLRDINLIEINELFAPQVLACVKELGLGDIRYMDRVNINGGGIAMGNPIAANGAILVMKLIHQLIKKDLRRGLVATSIGGGQGFAMVIEKY